MNERPKFSLAVGDQPVAVAVASPPADKFDARSINRKAVAAWPILFHMLVDIRGFPNGDIWALNPANPPIDPNRRRQDGPRLVAFSGVNYWENEDGSGPGAWTNRATGDSGKDVVSLLQFLSAGGDRRVCAEYLRSVTDRVVAVK